MRCRTPASTITGTRALLEDDPACLRMADDKADPIGVASGSTAAHPIPEAWARTGSFCDVWHTLNLPWPATLCAVDSRGDVREKRILIAVTSSSETLQRPDSARLNRQVRSRFLPPCMLSRG